MTISAPHDTALEARRDQPQDQPRDHPSHQPRGLPQSRAGRIAAVSALVIGVGLLVWQCAWVLGYARDSYLLDLGVFRDTGQAIVDGGGLYGDDLDSRTGFPFIYPPLAAALFVPLTWVNDQTMEMLWTLASVVAAWAVLAMAAHRLRLRWAPLVALPMLGLALCMEPLRANMEFGQINVFLVLLVTADVLGFTPRRLRGVGVGLAAGIKITPAAFALVFLVTRRWGDLARSAGTFLVTAALGWLMRPGEAVFFWTSEFFDDERAGPPSFEANQAATGLLTRAGMDGDLAQTVMLPVLLAVAVAAGWASLRLLRAGRPVTTLLLLVLAVSVAAPYAVTHHWSGVIVAVALLASQLLGGVRDWPTTTAAALLVVVNVFLHYRIADWGWVQDAVGQPWILANAQGVAGIVALLLLFLAAWRAVPEESVAQATELQDAVR
ncbi:glycosyltransferase 87 family protein [Corynebacterium sp. AOP40-9SA-29]|uniref:glycosyltransferase 87 family protein n=1 Tax=Corynebacterium sp. AOP40-9SA-29 TaxID=3457677 RepID=UPI004033701C